MIVCREQARNALTEWDNLRFTAGGSTHTRLDWEYPANTPYVVADVYGDLWGITCRNDGVAMYSNVELHSHTYANGAHTSWYKPTGPNLFSLGEIDLYAGPVEYIK